MHQPDGPNAAPRTRGVKRKAETTVDKETPSCDAGDTQGAVQNSCTTILHGVEGRYLKGSKDNALAHATALVLGRLYLMVSERQVSERTVPYLLTLLQKSGAPVGQTCHNPEHVRAFLHVCCALRSKWTRRDFWAPPRNLTHPSAWRLVFDGFTMRSGATVIVVLVAYTNSEGEIATEFLGCTPPAVDSTGPACAASIVDLLEDRLGVQSSDVKCIDTVGLPAHQPRRGDRAESRRAEFLTSMPVDRAYCGATGNKADDEVGKRLGITGLLGTVGRRVGMADAFHCIDGSATRVFGADAKNDDSDSSDSTDVGESALRQCFRMQAMLRHVLGRGHGNAHLVQSYQACGIVGRPKIMVTSNTRMIVYCSQMLRQSLRHYAARYRATWSYYGALAATQGKDTHRKKRKAQVLRVGRKMSCCRQILAVLVTHALLCAEGGVIKTALQVQQTSQVFFPLHMELWTCEATLCRMAFDAKAKGAHRSRPELVLRRCWKCRVCGLLTVGLTHMGDHVRRCHVDKHGNPRAEQKKLLLNPQSIDRHWRLDSGESMQGACVDWWGSMNALVGGQQRHNAPLAATQDSTLSIADLRRWSILFKHLVSWANFPGENNGCVPLQTCVEAFFVFLGGQRWRAVAAFWSAMPGIMLTGRWQGCSVTRFGPILDEGSRAPRHSRRSWNKMCDTGLEAIDEVHVSFRALANRFRDDVLQSHGNHIPEMVRGCSVLLFWMPEILQKEELSAQSPFWNGVKPVLDPVLGYVSNQVKAFDWPGSAEMLRQYVTMMCLWWKLGRTKKVAATLWGYARADSRTEAVRFPSRDTGATNKKVFMWKEWWRLTHTDQKFKPEGLEGAFALYHFLGSLGVSEALAESICSTLGRHANACANKLALQRVVEKTMLCRGTSSFMNYDDMFILRAWGEYFGGLAQRRFKFVTTTPRARAHRFPLGRGSSVIHHHVKRVQKKVSSAHAMRTLPLLAEVKADHRAWGARRWIRKLAK